MTPPINRENLRDVLIAIVVATGLAWVVGALEGRQLLHHSYHLSLSSSAQYAHHERL